MLPSVEIRVKVQHGNHNNPRLEVHILLPSLVTYVKVQHDQQQKSKVGNSYIVYNHHLLYYSQQNHPSRKESNIITFTKHRAN